MFVVVEYNMYFFLYTKQLHSLLEIRNKEIHALVNHEAGCARLEEMKQNP